jgi:hypothetical protein
MIIMSHTAFFQPGNRHPTLLSVIAIQPQEIDLKRRERKLSVPKDEGGMGHLHTSEAAAACCASPQAIASTKARCGTIAR